MSYDEPEVRYNEPEVRETDEPEVRETVEHDEPPESPGEPLVELQKSSPESLRAGVLTLNFYFCQKSFLVFVGQGTSS